MNYKNHPTFFLKRRSEHLDFSPFFFRLTNLTIGILSLIFLVLSLPSCTANKKNSSSEKEEYKWQVVKKEKSKSPDWVIYSRQIEGTNFFTYKIEGNISASPSDCLTAFKSDIHQKVNDNKNKKFPTYDLVEESPNSLLTYVIHKEPFPLKNTEMSVRYQFYNNNDGSTGAHWKEAWEESPIQPSKRLKRVESFRGSWDFKPINKDISSAINTVSFDPKKMPLWLVEPMVVKFLKNGLRDLKEMTSNKIDKDEISIN